MRIHHKDGVTTDWAGQPALFSGQLFICGMNLSKNWIYNFYREYIGYSWRQSTVTDGRCKYNTSWTRNSRTNIFDKRLRNIVHDYKHILTDIERIVNNNVNNETHADELTMQHWAHCTQSVVASSDVFTSSLWLKADLICLFTFIPSMHMCLRPWVLFSSFSPSTSCSTSHSSFSSSWRTPATPWTSTPCATPLTGPSSPWTIACPTHAKDVICPKQGEFIFPIADGRIKTSGRDQELRASTLVRHRPIQGESNIDFLGESEGSLPQPHDSLPDAGEAINDFWSLSGSFIYRHHVEPRVKLYSPREESFPIPLKYIDVSRTTHTNLDVKQEKRIDDYWNIDGSRDLSDPWTGFHIISWWTETNNYRRVLRESFSSRRSLSTKSYWDGGITKIPEFYLRYARKTEAHRGPQHYYGIIRKITRTAKWSKLYERF